MNVTVHHFDKATKPISVHGRPFGCAKKSGGFFEITASGTQIGRVAKFREIEFFVMSFLKNEAEK